MTDPVDELDDLAARLREAAARLRDRDLSADDAATLVDECARLASQAGAELDRRARAGGASPPAGQGELL